MFLRRPLEGTSVGASPPPGPPLPLLPLLLLLLLHTSSASPVLSLLVPWGESPGAAGALQGLGEAPFLSTPADHRRLQEFLESDRVRGLTDAGLREWEPPKSPDLFLLTEVTGAEEQEEEEPGRGQRRRRAPMGAAGAAQPDRRGVGAEGRLKRSGFLSTGGSRIRAGGSGGGFAGSAGMRVGVGGGFGPGGAVRGPAGGRMSEGPSLSIVNPLDVLRQRLLLEIARRRMRESEDQIQANRELLKSIGKRAAAPGGGSAPGEAQIPSSM